MSFGLLPSDSRKSRSDRDGKASARLISVVNTSLFDLNDDVRASPACDAGKETRQIELRPIPIEN